MNRHLDSSAPSWIALANAPIGAANSPLANLRPPEFHLSIVAARRKRRTVGREGKAIDLGFVSWEGEKLLASERVPEPDDSGLARNGDALAIRAVGQAERPVVLKRHAPDRLAGTNVPDRDDPLLIGGNERFSVRSKRNGGDGRLCMQHKT